MSDDIFDAIVVGAGCAGSVAAYTLASAGKSVLVIERGNYAGAKNMTGGRIYTHSLKEVFPDFASEAPLQRKIAHERISLMSENSTITLDFTADELTKEGRESYAVLRAPFDQWLAEKAEEAGAEYIYGIAVEQLILREEKVCGIVAGGDEIEARVTILCDGINSLLTKQAGLLKTTPAPHQLAVGVKETIALSPQLIEDRLLCNPGEGAAWLFAGDCSKGKAGGAFMYTNENSLSLGIVAILSDLIKGDISVYQMLEDFKNRSDIQPLIKGGTTVEYSGHLVPEGGLSMVPALVGEGVLVAGDAAMFCINLGFVVRGMDFAITSGKLAAEAAIESLEKEEYSAASLSSYQAKLDYSFIMRDLKHYKGFPSFLEETTRMFNEYPLMVRDIMSRLFCVDGKPQKKMKNIVMDPLKEVGLMNIMKDMRKGMKAL